MGARRLPPRSYSASYGHLSIHSIDSSQRTKVTFLIGLPTEPSFIDLIYSRSIGGQAVSALRTALQRR